MKKILMFMLVMFVCISGVSAANYTLAQSDDTDTGALAGSSPTSRYSYGTFTTNSSGYYLGRVAVKLGKVGSPTGTIKAYIMSTDGVNIINNSEIISDTTYDIASDLTTTRTYLNFTWDTPINLNGSTTYAIVVDLVTTSTPNYVTISYSNVAGRRGGGSSLGSLSESSSAQRLTHRVYSTEAPAPTPEITFEKIEVNNETFVNNSYFNVSDLNFVVNVNSSNNIIYTGNSFSVGGQELYPQGITWDGSTFWVIGSATDTAYQYYANGTYTGNSFSTAVSIPEAITSDGTYLYIAGGGTVGQYYTNGTFTGFSFAVLDDDGLTWDGTAFWVIGRTYDTAYKYYANGTYTGNSFYVGAQDNFPQGITWDGSTFWIAGENTKKIYQYYANGTYTGNFFDTSTIDSGSAIDMVSDGTYLWFLSYNHRGVYQYSNIINMTYNLYNSTFGLINSTQFSSKTSEIGTFSLNLTEESYYIDFFVEDNVSNTTSGLYNFTIDTTNPIINLSLPSEYNYYDNFNLSQYINVTETNPSTCTVDLIYNTSIEKTVECTNESVSFDYNGNYTLNVTATDLANNTASESDIMLVNPYQYIYFQDSDLNPVTNFTFAEQSYGDKVQATVYNDIFIFGTNNYTFEKFGYIAQSLSITINTTSNINKTYNATESKIIVTIRDKVTSNIINTSTFNLELVGTIGATTNTTNGTAIFENLFFQDEEYLLIVSSDDYLTEQKIFNFDNQELIELTVYMLDINETNIGLVEIEVIDNGGAPLENATIQALQYDSNTSTYIVVAEKKTGTLGKGILNIILSDKLYKFRAIYEGITVTTVAQIIESDTSLTITIPAIGVAPEALYKNLVIESTEDFNNITNISTINVSWVDGDGIDREVCIKAYRLVNGKKINYDTYCGATSSSGSFQRTFFINSSFSILLEVGLNTDDNGFIAYDSYYHYNNLSISGFLESNELLAFFALILMIGSIWLGLEVNLFVGIICLIFSGGLGYQLSPQYLTGTITAFFMFVGGLIIWGGSKK